MAYNKEFSKERYADLMPILDRILLLEPGESITLACKGKSAHTVGQKIREYLKLAGEARPDADIDRKSISVTVSAAAKKVIVTKKKPLSYGAVIVEE